ncbi:MAG: hypothetical protein JNM10_02230, partial [Planctomycetia bacterium]|nr:hypothetical protein [Planctomycetia bacterium]
EALFATTVAAGPVGVWGLPGLAYRGAWPVRAFGVAPFARAGDDRAVVVRDDGTAALVPVGDDAVPPRVLEVVGPASVAVAPDGGTAVFGTLGGSAYVHDLRAPAGTPPRVWRAVRDTVTSAAFAPDGSRVFLGFGDNRVAVWDPEAGTEQLVLERHRSMVTGLAVTPDGTTVVAADGQGAVMAWSTEPLAVRWRRAAEERGRVAAWRTRLRARLAAGETAATVRASLDADPGLSARERGSAWVALLTEVFGR